MSYEASVYSVLIASPSDVAPERNVIREILAEWNAVHSFARKTVLLPHGWETNAWPAMGDRPQALLNQQMLIHCDLLVGIFWTRIGTPTGAYVSGSVEEIEEHIKSGKPAMLYFSQAPVIPDSVDAAQYEELKRFRESCRSRGLLETYTDLNDFRSKFYRHLQLRLNQEPFSGAGAAEDGTPQLVAEGDRQAIPSLSREAQTLLKEARQDPMGIIQRLETLGGLLIATNGKSFVEQNDPRTRAIWEDAVRELETEGLIADRGYKREVFRVTREGYEVAKIVNP